MTIESDDVWNGAFARPDEATITVHPEAAPIPIGILDSKGRMLHRMPPHIGFLPWQTDDR